jgi:hypothetical protein
VLKKWGNVKSSLENEVIRDRNLNQTKDEEVDAANGE